MRSRREIECLRCAANVLAVGIDSIRRRLDVNRTELDLYGTHVHHMVASGGEIPWKYPGTIKVNPLQSYEIPGRTEVRPGDMVFVSTSGVFEGQYASACRAFYLQVNLVAVCVRASERSLSCPAPSSHLRCASPASHSHLPSIWRRWNCTRHSRWRAACLQHSRRRLHFPGTPRILVCWSRTYAS